MYKISLRSFLLFFVSIAVSSVFTLSAFAAELSPEQERRLRNELEQVEKEIKEQQSILSSKQAEASSIERDIAILNAKIAGAKLKIKKHNIEIERLGKDIVVKSGNIKSFERKIEDGKASLSQILRKTNELDAFSVPEVLLGGENISDFFSDIDLFVSVKESLKDTFTELRQAKDATEQEKSSLEEKRNEEIDTKINVETEKLIIERGEAEKKRLLALNKAEQGAYNKVIADKAKRVSEIKAALFKLRDAEAIPFGTALEYAKNASKLTGVRPAFVLAIITQESNLGANVGSCYLTNDTTGEGVRVTTGVTVKNVMKPERDITPFIQITKDLGRDYRQTRVSCPLSVGYGGAMGPAQFIPSTWQLFAGRIASALKADASDPWNPEHALMASSIYLGDLGAVASSYTAERNAACKYYSGRACGVVKTNTFYGDQVMARVKAIQANIDILEGN
jgi:peptidoglycan hydrolase CwlO-like protein